MRLTVSALPARALLVWGLLAVSGAGCASGGGSLFRRSPAFYERGSGVRLHYGRPVAVGVSRATGSDVASACARARTVALAVARQEAHNAGLAPAGSERISAELAAPSTRSCYVEARIPLRRGAGVSRRSPGRIVIASKATPTNPLAAQGQATRSSPTIVVFNLAPQADPLVGGGRSVAPAAPSAEGAAELRAEVAKEMRTAAAEPVRIMVGMSLGPSALASGTAFILGIAYPFQPVFGGNATIGGSTTAGLYDSTPGLGQQFDLSVDPLLATGLARHLPTWYRHRLTAGVGLIGGVPGLFQERGSLFVALSPELATASYFGPVGIRAALNLPFTLAGRGSGSPFMTLKASLDL